MKATQSTEPPERAIYSVALLGRRAPGTRKVLEAIPYTETSPETWVRCDVREAGERADFRVPFGPRRVPESQMINFIGEGSGFAPNTPRLRVVIQVSSKDSDRPFEDVWGGGSFRSSSWLVSDRTRQVLEAIDPAGFEYWPVETQVWQGGERMPDLKRWLCEPVRFLRVFEKPSSLSDYVEQRHERRFRFQSIPGSHVVFFRDESSALLFCSDAGREAFKSADLKGLNFDLVGYQHA